MFLLLTSKNLSYRQTRSGVRTCFRTRVCQAAVLYGRIPAVNPYVLHLSFPECWGVLCISTTLVAQPKRIWFEEW